MHWRRTGWAPCQSCWPPPSRLYRKSQRRKGMGTMKESQSLQDVKGAEGAVDGEQENEDEELRCVIAIARHGDRTPKQKLKINITQPCLLELFHKYQEKGKQAKLKSPAQLQELLDVVRGLSVRLDQVSQAMEKQAHKREEEQTLEQQQKQQEQQPKPQHQHQQGGQKQGHKKDAQGLQKKQQQQGKAEQKEQGKVEQKEHAAPAVQHAHAEPAGAPKQKSPDAPAAVAPLPPITTSAGAAQQAGTPAPKREASLFADPTLGYIEGRDALDEMREKLRIVRTVLEQGGHFSGVNRKVQIKPVRWGPAHDQPLCPANSTDAAAAGSQAAGATAAAASRPGDANNPSTKGESKSAQPALLEGLLVVKWGGVLTHAGRQQAEQLGMHFRACMYPKHGPAGGGLLRLHSTYRHDLKIYSSDEGRVQTSAAAFTKGLLDLEGNSLTPILVSLVNKDASMLEAF
ncbi:histidine phosphatase superfamily-domain-containing protein, partial [Dunaliella salina]